MRVNKRVLIFVLLAGLLPAEGFCAEVPRTTLKAVHAMTNAQASKTLLVNFEATITYYRRSEHAMFVQDDGIAIFINPQREFPVQAGDRVFIHGVTHDSFRPIVEAYWIDNLGPASMPKAVAASFDDLMRARYDCMFVAISGVVRSADLQIVAGAPYSRLQLVTDGGNVSAVVDSYDRDFLNSLLDSEVEITGAASGDFDGKMHQTGVVIHMPAVANIRVIKRPSVSPWARPVAAIDEIVTSYHVRDMTQRVNVQGTITYYQPGSAMVLQHDAQSLWVQTQALGDFRVGDVVDATGFPEVRAGFLTLANGEIEDHHLQVPVQPKQQTPRELSYSHNIFDLVSLEGEVVTEVRENTQDEYVLIADGYRLSAILRHPPLTNSGEAVQPPMRMIPLGSTVRISGICVLEDSNPFNAQVPFNILLRTGDDITVVARPSPINSRNLTLVAGLLVLVVIAVSGWGWTLRRQVQMKTAELAVRIEAEAAQERRLAELEKHRSTILEHINGMIPLTEILEEIVAMASMHLNGAPCWCETADGMRVGLIPESANQLRVASTEIAGRSGEVLGRFFAGMESQTLPNQNEYEALSLATHLSTLAIETRQVYSDLHQRSEFDQLTGLHNRFSLDRVLKTQMLEARQTKTAFGLIYIDLDKFKHINDFYGHHVGDLYLVEVSRRMKQQLRTNDTLARFGGDEFIALLPDARSRGDLEEIARRLERSFDEVFRLDGNTFQGTASIGIALYLENADTEEGLFKAADYAMYTAKKAKEEAQDMQASGSQTA